jgi:hypothetical protein
MVNFGFEAIIATQRKALCEVREPAGDRDRGKVTNPMALHKTNTAKIMPWCRNCFKKMRNIKKIYNIFSLCLYPIIIIPILLTCSDEADCMLSGVYEGNYYITDYWCPWEETSACE